MHVLMLLKSELRRSAGVLLGMALVLALSLALAVSAGLTERMLRSSSAAAADRFDLLVGAKGSATSLLLGTVYLRDEPLGLVPAEAMNSLIGAKGVRWAAPVAFGDRVGRAALVGTTRALVTFGGAAPLSEGRVFEAPNEAVAGAASGLKVGDTFLPMHGRAHGAGHAHAESRFTVVGVMPASGTPWDRAVLVPIERIWSMHGADAHEEHEEHDHATEPLEEWMHEDLSKLPGMSAVVVKPVTVADAYRLRQVFSKKSVNSPDGTQVNLMGVFSGEVLVELYAAMGGAAKALSFITALTVAIALAATLITGVLLGRLRLPTLLELRVLGAPRVYVGTLLWLIVMTVAVAGTAGGIALGWLFASLCGTVLEAETGIAMAPLLSLAEAKLALMTLGSGAVCALIPAWLAGRAKMH
ncbi:ABC transporter permease [Sutterella sp.]|uniref:ABC transporter permease n=1 Tax=Sutterella sp. TaxID=1981025 RepID=UPI0026DF9400|nr:ABC transporter permease [Sutterella sp.]MDO5531868.1 ABC transporter permease [Sutterella sp.]